MSFLLSHSTFLPVYNDIRIVITCGYPDERIIVYIYIIFHWMMGLTCSTNNSFSTLKLRCILKSFSNITIRVPCLFLHCNLSFFSFWPMSFSQFLAYPIFPFQSMNMALACHTFIDLIPKNITSGVMVSDFRFWSLYEILILHLFVKVRLHVRYSGENYCLEI